MSLPDAWVEKLFARLTVRYGVSFTGMYKDVDPKLVKGDWAVALAGFNAEAIAYGLENLPADRAPNAIQFRDICRKAPTIFPPALPAPKADPERVKAALSKLSDAPQGKSLAQQCIENIERARERGLLTENQRHVLAACKAMESVQ